MNIQSYILLGIVVIAFIAVARFLHRGGGKRSCCKDCGGDCCQCH